MKIFVWFMALSFINSSQASFRVQQLNHELPPYQQPPSYQQSNQIFWGIQGIINEDFLQRLHNLQKNSSVNSKYQYWTVKDYENELRGCSEDGKLILSNQVHRAIAIRLWNIRMHQLSENIFEVWAEVAKSLQIKEASINAVEDKIKEFEQLCWR